ncbi:MAG TPA: hypothetical protein VME20_03410 [Acidimicrobiales bacterium]|nr:hypothetical protein [Acidimicrobiales bacterium]
MADAHEHERPARSALVVLAVLGIGLSVWFARRPDQLLHPYVWADEYHILNRYQMEGFAQAVLAPVKGYFIWPTSFSVAVAASADFAHLPEVEYWFATVWFAVTLCLILLPRSVVGLHWRAAAALLLVLTPMNPEVFGVALYIFWWTSLWPVVTFGWLEGYWWLRAPVLVIGGMSSLAGAAMVVPSAVLFVAGKKRRDLWATVLLALTCVPQGIAYFSSARSGRTPLHPAKVALQELHNFSTYALGWLKPENSLLLDVTGALVFVLTASAVFKWKARSAPAGALGLALFAALLTVGFISAVPAPLSTNPATTGPRYYFLPFALLGWVLLAMLPASPGTWRRLGAGVLIVLSFLCLQPNFSRHEPAVSWGAQLARCKGASTPFYVPVQFTGVPSQMWRTALVITPRTCRSLGFALPAAGGARPL